MSPDPAQWLEIATLVAKSARIEFELPLAGMPRIVSLLRRADGTARGALQFHRVAPDESGRGFDAADGNIAAALVLTCQRCLEELQVAVDAECHLAFVDTESAAALVPESRDPVVMTQGRVELAELVEEELLLALPHVPKHAASTACADRTERAQTPAREQAPTQRPFANLRDLMKK